MTFMQSQENCARITAAADKIHQGFVESIDKIQDAATDDENTILTFSNQLEIRENLGSNILVVAGEGDDQMEREEHDLLAEQLS